MLSFMNDNWLDEDIVNLLSGGADLGFYGPGGGVSPLMSSFSEKKYRIQ